MEKLCKDCAHVSVTDTVAYYSFDDPVKPRMYYCVHPQVAGFDLVTGDLVRVKCHEARYGKSQICGVEGFLFEARKTEGR